MEDFLDQASNVFVSIPISMIAWASLLGVLIHALVALRNARKRGELDTKLTKFKSELDKLNAVELASVQAQHSEKLKRLESELTESAAAQDRVRDADALTLEKVLEILNPDEVISPLRYYDFGATFKRSMTDPVIDFIKFSKRPDSGFLDSKLEDKRKSLINISENLITLLGAKTHPRKDYCNSVLPENLINEVRPPWVDENASEINECATNFVEAFDELVRYARLRAVGHD